MSRSARWLRVLAFVALAPAALADPQLKVKPGRWEVQVTLRSPGSGDEQTRDVTLCIDEAGIAPQALVSAKDGCTVSDVRIEDAEMRWKVVCANQGEKLRGNGRLSSRDDTIKGKLSLRTVVGGQSVDIEQRWEGKWVSPGD